MGVELPRKTTYMDKKYPRSMFERSKERLKALAGLADPEPKGKAFEAVTKGLGKGVDAVGALYSKVRGRDEKGRFKAS